MIAQFSSFDLAVLFAATIYLPGSTATAVAAGPQLAVAHRSIQPGQRQTVTIRGLPAAQYQLEVIMPNGDVLAALARTGSTPGTVRWSFLQPPGTITHTSRRATLRLTVGSRAYGATYMIAFSPLDVVVPRQSVPENSTVVLWFHARPHLRVNVQLSIAGQVAGHRLVTGTDGWAPLPVHVVNDLAPFRTITVSVVASTVVAGALRVARADFRVLPFKFGVSLGKVRILHKVGDTWEETSTLRRGDDVRIEAFAGITEPAGSMPQCVGGQVAVIQQGTTLQLAPLNCSAAAPGQEIAEFQLSPGVTPGTAELNLDASFENGTAHVAVPISVISS